MPHGNPITLTPVAVIRTPFRDRIETPHQPVVSADPPPEPEMAQPGPRAPVLATIEFAEWVPPESLQDLEGFDRVWLIYHLHRSEGWRARVKPPRGPRRARGLFATRSPHRPNPIGLSCVRLVSVDGPGRRVVVADVDLLDGTPILDLKPYVPYADAFPDARAGWVDEVDAAVGRLTAPGPKRPVRARSREVPGV